MSSHQPQVADIERSHACKDQSLQADERAAALSIVPETRKSRTGKINF